jgi:hypothetical protein
MQLVLRNRRFRDGLPLDLAGLLHPGGRGIPSNCAAVMENGGIRDGDNGSAQAQGGESGKEQVFHRNSPKDVQHPQVSSSGLPDYEGVPTGEIFL